tara:strand:- start:1258 stop:1797 length:540 start_codon:yes stop_codon:yes gene_type:complete
MQVYEFENFLNPSECDYILRWFSSANRQPENGEELFDGRTIPYKYVDEDTVKSIMNQFRFNSTFQAITSFQKRLYPEYTDLVYWPVGMNMEVHSDATDLQGQPAKYPWRTVSGVIYLNDDYQGGETYFPNQNIKIIPKKGKLVLFPSNLEYKHGVTQVIAGDRYTMPIWFTEDSTKIEI